MMRFSISTVVVLLAVSLRLGAAEYKMSDGTTITGEPFSVNETGMVVRQQPDGKLSGRFNWLQFSPEALKEIGAKDPKAKAFIEAIIEPPAEAGVTMTPVGAAKPPPPLQLNPVPRPDRPTNVTLGMALVTPVGLAMILLLMLANLYAGYEIAIYRDRAPGLVIGSAAVAPLLGPLIFLCLPGRSAPKAAAAPEPVAEPMATEESPPPVPGSPEAEAYEAIRAASAPPPAESVGEDASAPSTGREAIIEEGEPAPIGLRLAKREKDTTPASRDFKQSYKRGEQIINRRFFESKLTGFFRVVPGESERDLVIVIRSARGEYVGQRISRISNDELHIQRRAGDSSADTMIPFNDILEVTVRHKDAS